VFAAYAFDSLQDFLNIYWAGLSVLRTEADYHALTAAYLARAHADHVVHSEVFFSPQGHTSRDLKLAPALDGILAAFAEARAMTGLTGGVILVVQRHRTEADALRMIEEAMPWRDRVLGLGLGGPELGNPPQKFARAFAAARALGWHTCAHAGEEGPAAYVADTLDVLQVERIDHGVRCEDDPALVRRLAETRIPLTVCPLSNVKLKVFERLADHNLKRLLEAGLCVTINSDDPPYFGGYVNANYTETAAALGLSAAQQRTIIENGFQAAFLDEPTRARHLAAVARHWASVAE
jgi:adenosine deaminase